MIAWTEVGHRLRVARLSRGMSEQQAADAIGVKLATYRRWEVGAVPRPPALLDLADTFDVSLDWLVRGDWRSSGRPPRGAIAILPVRRG